MRGLKPVIAMLLIVGVGSHLLQMRGLKLLIDLDGQANLTSHLLQMRGLKQACHDWKSWSSRVASFTDAWIETYTVICL